MAATWSSSPSRHRHDTPPRVPCVVEREGGGGAAMESCRPCGDASDTSASVDDPKHAEAAQKREDPELPPHNLLRLLSCLRDAYAKNANHPQFKSEVDACHFLPVHSCVPCSEDEVGAACTRTLRTSLLLLFSESHSFSARDALILNELRRMAAPAWWNDEVNNQRVERCLDFCLSDLIVPGRSLVCSALCGCACHVCPTPCRMATTGMLATLFDVSSPRFVVRDPRTGANKVSSLSDVLQECKRANEMKNGEVLGDGERREEGEVRPMDIPPREWASLRSDPSETVVWVSGMSRNASYVFHRLVVTRTGAFLTVDPPDPIVPGLRLAFGVAAFLTSRRQEVVKAFDEAAKKRSYLAYLATHADGGDVVDWEKTSCLNPLDASLVTLRQRTIRSVEALRKKAQCNNAVADCVRRGKMEDVLSLPCNESCVSMSLCDASREAGRHHSVVAATRDVFLEWAKHSDI